MSLPTATGNCLRKTQKGHVQITVTAEDNMTRCSYTNGASMKVLVQDSFATSKKQGGKYSSED